MQQDHFKKFKAISLGSHSQQSLEL
ncbi:hypothetical protein B4U79_06432 [Dinothrombium tinctorium]|uniref:Uncharacterized protein n=1 Tax=Dinothrombium tinctorium TaxID=1965070 RepID=A0A3S3PMD5_9ACAR|nr:hypothetical protein B4U79_06432 [Dinothrombium tinctorium]